MMEFVNIKSKPNYFIVERMIYLYSNQYLFKYIIYINRYILSFSKTKKGNAY
jgi:hypothetical protein